MLFLHRMYYRAFSKVFRAATTEFKVARNEPTAELLVSLNKAQNVVITEDTTVTVVTAV